MKSKTLNGVRKIGRSRDRRFWEDRLWVAEQQLGRAIYQADNAVVLCKLRKVAGCALSSRLQGVKLVKVMRYRKRAFLYRIQYASFFKKSKRKIPVLKKKILFYKSHIQKYLDTEAVKEVLDE